MKITLTIKGSERTEVMAFECDDCSFCGYMYTMALTPKTVDEALQVMRDVQWINFICNEKMPAKCTFNKASSGEQLEGVRVMLDYDVVRDFSISK